MGISGSVTLVNGSPYDWAVSSQHSYQMSTWNFPTVNAGKASKVSIEWGSNGNPSQDAGEAYYNIAETSNKFSLLGRNSGGYDITVSLDAISTNQSPQGSKINLGFRNGGSVNWILSTDEAGRWWSNSGTYTDWMQQSMGSLANRTLKYITMPGSHDAGMNTFKPGTVGADFANTQTQYLDFYNQLVVGSRYFDLRPVISDGQWVAGHYSEIDGVWVGGNGQALADIITQVNQFTAQYKELIIINLSHTLDSDNQYKDLTQDQWNQLFDTLKGINNRFTVSNPGNTDFSNNVLGDFITDRASVFIIAQVPGGISLGDYANQGFFSGNNFPIFDSYSDTNSLSTMEADQISKLHANRNIVASDADRKDTFSTFSWTLTQQVADVLNPDRAILNLAASAFDALVSDGWNAFTPESFPNVLYVDALGIRDKSVVFPYDKLSTVSVNTDITALAIAVNNGMAGRNPYVTGRSK